MSPAAGLVLLHIDGLGHAELRRALSEGDMPFTKLLMDQEGYVAQPYRCGVPSTTPFCQAGILYGDSSEIPSFRWWDKSAGLAVAFGAGSSFNRVAHRYFERSEPLARGGACIAACYPAGAEETFGLAYREQGGHDAGPSALQVILAFLANPANLADWLWHGVLAILRINWEFVKTRLSGRPAARAYVLSDLLEEIFLHHLARDAVRRAMDHGYPVIYAGFYAYDETAHAFGPGHPFSRRMLRHVDQSIRAVAEKRAPKEGARGYRLLVLSDHGQIETTPFNQADGRPFGELLAGLLPSYEVEELKGKTFGPRGEALDGHVVLAYSGGLAHVYFKDVSVRLGLAGLDERFPGLVDAVADLDRIEFVLVRDGDDDVIVTRQGRLRFGPRRLGAAAEPLGRLDDPEALAWQLHRLNSFQRSGDMILVGRYENGSQVNFENQVGGHGAAGGTQAHPFLLTRPGWGFDPERIREAADLHPQLTRFRDQLLGGADL